MSIASELTPLNAQGPEAPARINMSLVPGMKSSPAIDSPGVFESADYALLTGHARTDGSDKTDEQLRAEYIHRTDELIRLMTDGVSVKDPITNEQSLRRPDFVVWLDKSARPLAWLTKDLWPKLAPAAGKPVPEMPKFRFVNIDREQWVNVVDPQGSGRANTDLVDDSVIRSLRSTFVPPQYKQRGLTKAIDTAPAELDNKTVLIVDEVMASGKTLAIATNMLRRAFPTTAIASTHWMGGVTQRGRTMGNADLPVWYKENSVFGRGVGNRDERSSLRSNSLTQRLGAWFLSTRFEKPDPLSLQLRRELHSLAHDPEVLIVPSYNREDFDDRAMALNGLRGMTAFKRRKKALDDQKRTI